MGIISLNKASRLYWLGRYTERVYTGLKKAKPIYDVSVDGGEYDIADYCRRLGIPNEYADTADFCKRYFFEKENPNSLTASLAYAYDNAVVLRELLTSVTLSYIQMAMNIMEEASCSDMPGVQLQGVLDNILAFRGSYEESVADREARNIIRLGTSVERVDLYLRLEETPEKTRLEFERLFNRLYKTQLSTDRENLDLLVDSLLDSSKPSAPVRDLIGAVENLFPNL